VEFGKKKVISAVLGASLIVLMYMALLTTTSSPGLVVMAKRVGPGTYEIKIYGDASGLHSICEIFRQFSVMKLKWSTSMPTYPTGYVNFAVDVRDLNFEKMDDSKYHLSLKGLKEASILSSGTGFSVKARSGELDLVFSDPSSYYPYYYTTVDITGTLKGDVLFHIDAQPGLPAFHYEGSELTILVHIGMTDGIR